MIRFAIALLALALPLAAQQQPELQLTETEQLRGQNAVLRVQQLNATVQLLTERLTQIRQQQQEAQQALQDVVTEIYEAHGITMQSHRMDLDAGALVENPPAPTDVEDAPVKSAKEE